MANRDVTDSLFSAILYIFAGQPGIVDYYEIRFATADPTAPGTVWQFADTSKKSRFDLSGLTTGVKVWVELRACNARGKSPWSDPATKRVP